HVKMRVDLEASGAQMQAFIGEDAANPVFNRTLPSAPAQGRAHLVLGIVASGSSTPKATLQLDNITLDTTQ
ncbi:MAG: hypothetical protein ABI461_10110, partial [Polyangiaceae bacterium]